jgi:hypothetical protein
VTYCFDRFDLHITLAGMSEVSHPQIESLLATFWWKAAMAFAAVRGNRFA